MPDGSTEAVPFGPRFAVERSVERKTDEKTHWFSGFADYEAALRQAGKLGDEEDLLGRHDLLPEVIHHWISKGQPGCRFAQRLSHRPADYGWVDVVVSDHTDPEVPEGLELFLANNKDAQAVLVVLPTVSSVDHFVEFFANLGSHDNWRCVRIEEDPKHPVDEDTHTVVGLRWRPPQGGQESWPLVFGPADDIPFTRRAPVAAMAMRTHTPLPESAGIDLAAMDPKLPPMQRKRAANSTKKAKRLLLNGELVHAARAKSTLRVPKRALARLPVEES